VALDETRLLILGSQVLFGFLFQSVFQNGFDALSPVSKNLVCAALALMMLSIGCLIAPAMQHRIVEAGQSTPRLERATLSLRRGPWCRSSQAWGLGYLSYSSGYSAASRASRSAPPAPRWRDFSGSAFHG